MKKFLKITAATLILLLLFFAGIFKYRQYSANQTLIPSNTTALIKINVDEIYKSVAFNMLGNWGHYLKPEGKKSAPDKLDKFDTGLKIPASVYFYTLAGKPKTTFFSRLEIKDSIAFSNFVKHRLHLSKSKIQGIDFSRSTRGNFIIFYNKTTAAIALSLQSEDVEQALIDVLNQKDFVKLDKSNFNEFKKATSHIAFSDKTNSGNLNFDNGEINFNNTLLSQTIVPKTKASHRNFNPESTVTMWLNANFKKMENKIFKLKNSSLNPDSVLKYFDGYMDFEWVNSTQQTDSIITYEYNDDFEKVEKVSLQKSNVPQFSIQINANADGLKNYLYKQNIINLDSGWVNKTTFPLYKVFVNGTKDNLNFSTQKNKMTDNNTVFSEAFFYLNVNFLKLNKQINIPIITNYLKPFNRLEIKGKSLGNNTIKVDGKLELNNKDINSLYQILKGI